MKTSRRQRVAISTEAMRAAYERCGSVHAAAKELGVSHSTVHRRLTSQGFAFSNHCFTDAEIARVREYYEKTEPENFSLINLAAEMGRDKWTICGLAGRLGLTQKKRSPNLQDRKKIGERTKRYIAENGHPRGFLGGKHTDATKKVIGDKSRAAAARQTEDELAQKIKKTLTTKMERGNLINFRPQTTWKAGWEEIGGKRKYFRSSWEANYARYLEWLKSIGEILDWEHEVETFWFEGVKRGVMSYLPDFRVTEKNGQYTYHEVKGWMDEKSKTKIKRMAKYHPDVKLVVIDAKAYYALARKVAGLVPGWTTLPRKKS